MVNSHRTARAVVGLIVIENAVGYGMCVRGVFRGLVAVGFRLVVVTIHVPVSKLSVDMGRSRGSLVIEVVAGFSDRGWSVLRSSLWGGLRCGLRRGGFGSLRIVHLIGDLTQLLGVTPCLLGTAVKIRWPLLTLVETLSLRLRTDGRLLEVEAGELARLRMI